MASRRIGALFAFGLVTVLALGIAGGGAHADLQGIDETAPVYDVADQIMTLGTTSYPDTFAGVDTDDSASVTLYSTGDSGELISAAENIAASDSINITEITVDRSWTDLLAMTYEIADDWSSIEAAGYNLTRFGPDIQDNAVQVILAPADRPQPSDPVYIADAQSYLDATFGSGETIVSSIEPVPSDFTARDDETTPPFTGADGISIVGTGACTDSFAVTDSSGRKGVLTAGHCGSGDVTQLKSSQSYMGTVVDRKINDGKHDFEMVKTGENTAIWKQDTITYDVTGLIDPPGAGASKVSFNGDVTGEGSGAYVESVYQCVKFKSGGGYHTVCGVDYAHTLDGTQICHPGDSGGPVYHRLGGRNVQAAGMIVGGIIGDPTVCYFETLHYIDEEGRFSLRHS